MQLWHTCGLNTNGGSSLIAHDGAVYVTTKLSLHRLDAATGHRDWADTWDGSGAYNAPAVARGKIFAHVHRRLIAVDTRNGRVVWSAQAPDACGNGQCRVVAARGAVFTGLTEAGGVVYVVTHSNGLLAIEARSGSVIHHKYGDGFSQAFSFPIVAGGMVYFGTDVGVVSYPAAHSTDITAVAAMVKHWEGCPGKSREQCHSSPECSPMLTEHSFICEVDLCNQQHQTCSPSVDYSNITGKDRFFDTLQWRLQKLWGTGVSANGITPDKTSLAIALIANNVCCSLVLMYVMPRKASRTELVLRFVAHPVAHFLEIRNIGSCWGS
eukprot:gene28727-13151_t